MLVHRVTEEDNKLGVGQPIPGGQPKSFTNVDHYAAEKELYLGSKCQVKDTPNPWQFWMIMLKSGNMDTYAAKCLKNGHRVGPYGPDTKFPCFGKGCMNQPLIYHKYTTLQGPNMTTLRGRFFGSWDLDYDLSNGMGENSSYHSVEWEKEIGKGSWVFHHVLRTSVKYPWLMLYLRSDATAGFSGGYHYETRGMSKIVSNFSVSPIDIFMTRCLGQCTHTSTNSGASLEVDELSNPQVAKIWFSSFLFFTTIYIYENRNITKPQVVRLAIEGST